MVLEINLPEVNCPPPLFFLNLMKRNRKRLCRKYGRKKKDGKREESHKIRDDRNRGEPVRAERRKERRNLLFLGNKKER